MDRKLFIGSVVLLLFLTACQAQGSATDPTGVPAPSQSTPEMVTVYDEDGNKVQIPKPTPDYTDHLLDQVAEGELSSEQAVILGLRLMAGELIAQEAFGSHPVRLEGGYGLTALAVQVYHSSEDEEAKAEIARLMSIVAPSQEQIDRYAAPESEASRRAAGLAAPAAQSVSCTSIWASGFPTDVADPPVCVLYREFTAESYTYRVYFPEDRRADATLMTYVEAAFQALQDTREVYNPLSEMRSINLVFTQLPSSLEGSAAEVPGIDDRTYSGAACPISVYPLALSLNVDEFKQAIAHEMFHCLHFFREGEAGFTSGAWYQEGMAEYFSNVVYPTVNFEQRFATDFSFNSNFKWLMDMNYENAVFFQYLGSRFGNPYLIDLMDVLAYTEDTRDAQAAALAGSGDMQTIFHEFGQAFMMETIADTGGGNWPIRLYFIEENQFNIGEGRELLLTTPPFTLQRYIMAFEEGRQYEISKTMSGAPGKDSWRPPLPEAFTEIPASLATSCGTNTQRELLLTSASSPEGTQAEEQMDISSEGEAAYFDCCLVGTWEMGTAEIRSLFDSMSSVPVTDITGRFVLNISADGSSVFMPADYSATMLMDDRTTTVSITGSSTGSLVTPEEGRIFSSSGSTSFVQTLTVDGVSYSFPVTDSFGGPPAGEFGYTCNETSLVLHIPAGLAPFSTSSYHRVSEIPTTPEPGEGFPIAPGPGPSLPSDIGGLGGLCDQVSVTGFSTSLNTATWTLSNTGEALSLSGLSATWPASSSNLEQIALNGAPIWDGDEGSPALILSGWSGSETDRLLPSGGGVIDLIFTDSAAATGYGVTFQFEGGCTLLDMR